MPAAAEFDVPMGEEQLNIEDEPRAFLPSKLPGVPFQNSLLVDHRPDVVVLLALCAPEPQAHLIACATSQNSIKIYDRKSFSVTHDFAGHRGRITGPPRRLVLRFLLDSS